MQISDLQSSLSGCRSCKSDLSECSQFSDKSLYYRSSGTARNTWSWSSLLYLIWKSNSYTLQIYADIWLSPYWLWITKLQSHLSPAILNSATCEARANQIVTYIEFKTIFMNIESISYHSIVNRYMHNDHTLIFARIYTLHLGFSDSSSLAIAPSRGGSRIYKRGGLTQGTNLLGRGVWSTHPSMQSMLELGGSGGMPPPPGKIDAKILQFGDIST